MVGIILFVDFIGEYLTYLYKTIPRRLHIDNSYT